MPSTVPATANGDVATQEQVDAALDSLIDDSYATAADPSAIA